MAILALQTDSPGVVLVEPPAALVELLAAAPPDERRAHRRFAAADLHGLRSAKIKFGPTVTLLDLSAGGALLETDARLRPDSEAALELVADARRILMPFRVVRCQLEGLDGVPRYRGACEFSVPLDLADLLVPRALETIEAAVRAGALPVLAPAALRVSARNAW